MENVAKRYISEASRTTASYGGWHDFRIPRINPNIVSRELSEVQAVSKILGFDQQNLRDLLKDKNISIHKVGNSEIIRRTDLDRFLAQNPINGFVKYPQP